MYRAVILALVALAPAVANSCIAICGPDEAACGACIAPNCTNSGGSIRYTLKEQRVGACASGYFPVTYPICRNSTSRASNETAPIVTYTCTRDFREIQDSRSLQLAAHVLRLAYAISPPISTCTQSCVDVGLARVAKGTNGSLVTPINDPYLKIACGDCVPINALTVGARDVLAGQPEDPRSGRSSAVWGGGFFSYPGMVDSLLTRKRGGTVAAGGEAKAQHAQIRTMESVHGAADGITFIHSSAGRAVDSAGRGAVTAQSPSEVPSLVAEAEAASPSGSNSQPTSGTTNSAPTSGGSPTAGGGGGTATANAPFTFASSGLGGYGVPVRDGEEQTFYGRRIYVCVEGTAKTPSNAGVIDLGAGVRVTDGTMSQGASACLRELDARGLVDSGALCFDGVRPVKCPNGGSGHVGVEWVARVLSIAGVASLVISLHWWAVPVVQLVVTALSWCDEPSPLMRALYQGADIILMQWDITSSCADTVHPTACRLINASIGSGIILGAAVLLMICTHVLSRVVAAIRDDELAGVPYPPNNVGGGESSKNAQSHSYNDYYDQQLAGSGLRSTSSNSMSARIASTSFRLSLGGAVGLWWWLSMVPLTHYATAWMTGDVDDYSTDAWWLFAVLAAPILLAMVLLAFFAIAVSIATAIRVSREVRGLPAKPGDPSPVLAQTPYGQIVSAVGGYNPLYRAFVAHPHGPASLVSATAAVRNRGWVNWFPAAHPLAWATAEGVYEGDAALVKQFGVVYNSFNPSNIPMGSVVSGICTVTAFVSGLQCTYVGSDSCCIIRAVLCVILLAALLLAFFARRPLLGDNILPVLLLLAVFLTWFMYFVFVAADTMKLVPPQVTLVVFVLVVFGYAVLMGLLHAGVRVAHMLAAEDVPQQITTIALGVDVAPASPRKQPAAAPGVTSVPTYHYDGTVMRGNSSSPRATRSQQSPSYTRPSVMMRAQSAGRGDIPPAAHNSHVRQLQQQQQYIQAYQGGSAMQSSQNALPPRMSSSMYPQGVPSTPSRPGSAPYAPGGINWAPMGDADKWPAPAADEQTDGV